MSREIFHNYSEHMDFFVSQSLDMHIKRKILDSLWRQCNAVNSEFP